MDELDGAERRDLLQLLALLDKIGPWINAIASDASAGFHVQDHSSLATDDQRTHPYQVSYRAWMAITAAVDFLHCLRRTLTQGLSEESRDIMLHTYAQMGLVRGALENASCAVWLLGPPQRIERITNRLGLEWSELRSAYALRELTPSQAPRTIEQRKQQLIDLLLAAASNTNSPVAEPVSAAQTKARKAFQDVSYTSIVQRAGELTPAVGSTRAEAVWRMCSAFAHGDTSATLGLLTTEPVEQDQPGIKLIHISANVRLLYQSTLVAYRMTEKAFQLLQERTAAPF